MKYVCDWDGKQCRTLEPLKQCECEQLRSVPDRMLSLQEFSALTLPQQNAWLKLANEQVRMKQQRDEANRQRYDDPYRMQKSLDKRAEHFAKRKAGLL